MQPEGSRLEVGEYRLELTYRRDNTASDPDSQILRERRRRHGAGVERRYRPTRR